jgi:hypothetical protein
VSLKNGVAVSTCAICNKPVSLEIAKIDEDGQNVHEQCYVLKIQREQLARSRKAGNIRKLSDA